MMVREIVSDDYAQLMSLQRRNGLSVRTLKSWSSLLYEHPQAEFLQNVSRGWVMENEEGLVVGSATSIPLAFSYKGSMLRGACAAVWVSDPDYRAKFFGLSMRWTGQKNLDILIDTSANSSVSRMLKTRGFLPIPIGWSHSTLLWVLDHQRFVESLSLKYKYVPSRFSYSLGKMVELLDSATGSRKIEKKKGASRYTVEEQEDFDCTFSDFWMELSAKSSRLLVLRDALTLSWRHSEPKTQGRLCILTARRDGLLKGYMVLWHSIRHDINLESFVIADFQLIEYCETCAAELLRAALKAARSRGIHVLETAGLDSWKFNFLKRAGGHEMHTEAMSYYYKAPSKEMSLAFDNSDCWDPMLSDGF